MPAGGDLILTEMSSQGLDTSETPVGGCTQSGYIPVIHATVNGLHIDWKDFDQVLNTHFFDRFVEQGIPLPDPKNLQSPATVADAMVFAAQLPAESAMQEMLITPFTETSWP